MKYVYNINGVLYNVSLKNNSIMLCYVMLCMQHVILFNIEICLRELFNIVIILSVYFMQSNI